MFLFMNVQIEILSPLLSVLNLFMNFNFSVVEAAVVVET